MDKLEEVKEQNLRGQQENGIRSQRELEAEVARQAAVIQQQTEALEKAEQEIIRLRAELYEYYRQVINNQHQQIQELSSDASTV